MGYTLNAKVSFLKKVIKRQLIVIKKNRGVAK